MIAFERATMISKSFLIGLALVERHLTVEGAVKAAQVELTSQITRWGEIEDGKLWCEVRSVSEFGL
jgi:ATP synthase F1 complex assembly factor 2